MVNDVNQFNNPPYVADTVNARIAYGRKGVVDYRNKYRYRTIFAYLHEYEKGSFSEPEATKNLKKNLAIWVICGYLSYTNINPDCILGVSGTVKDLSDEERRIIRNFNIDSYSFLPSIYGENR